MLRENMLQYKSSAWLDSEGKIISTCQVYDKVQVEVMIENPTRKQTITSIVKVPIFRDVPHGLDERVKEESRLLTLPPLSTGTVSVGFIPMEESGYYFTVLIEGKDACKHLKNFPCKLYAQRFETTLILDKPKNSIPPGSPITFTGKLVRTDTGEGIAGAEVFIFGNDKVKNKLEATGITGNDGSFSLEWTAQKIEWWDSTVKIYAKFKGDDVFKPSTSSQYIVRIK